MASPQKGLTPDELEWALVWGAIHEAGHAVVARHFGIPIVRATLQYVRIEHRRYTSPDCENSMQRLIISAAGDSATTEFFGYTGTGSGDIRQSATRLYKLGADFKRINALLLEARHRADELVWQLRQQIEVVADALRVQGDLTTMEIDRIIRAELAV